MKTLTENRYSVWADARIRNESRNLQQWQKENEVSLTQLGILLQISRRRLSKWFKTGAHKLMADETFRIENFLNKHISNWPPLSSLAEKR